MATPRLEINLEKIGHNLKILKELFATGDISICAVTKGVCGNLDIARIMVEGGIKILADSRIDNLKKMHNGGLKCQFLLLGSPMLSEADSIVKYANISLNSEVSIIRELARSALKQDLIHKVILMVELGDLREGIMPADLDSIIEEVLQLKGIELVGIGTNLACFGGVQPDKAKMELLSSIANNIEKKFNISLEFVSGGNSANYEWFLAASDPGRINNLRLGESIFLGRETLNRTPIPELFTDAFTLVAEVTELKTKPSVPYGKIGQNAFGQELEFQDNGLCERAILGIGLQDVPITGLKPKAHITILGGGSDHMIINPGKSGLKLGSEVRFDLNYAALLGAMTSPYVTKENMPVMNALEYCEMIESKDILHKELEQNFPINEDGSSLVSLKGAGFKLMYEPSIMKDYQYQIRELLVEKIGRISEKLDKEDKTLVIRSAWRSFKHQGFLWDRSLKSMQKKFPGKPDEEIRVITSYFIAPPKKSTHSTGGAIDALIFDDKTKEILDFGTNKGLEIELNKKCYPHHPEISNEARDNRKLLIGLFEEENFVCDLKEFWHFDYGNIGWAIEKGENHAFYGIIENNSTW